MRKLALYHWTLRPYTVIRRGLDPRQARSHFKAIWLCSLSQIWKIRSHLAKSHKRPEKDFTLLRVEIPRGRLRRRRRGIYTCTRPVSKRFVFLGFFPC